MTDDNSNSRLQRRSFVKWAGIAGAGLASAGSASATGGSKDQADIDCQAALWGARCRQISVRCNRTFTVEAYMGKGLRFRKTKKGGGHIRKSLDEGYVSKIKVYHKGKLVTTKTCEHDHQADIDCQAALWGARCRQISVRCDKTFTVKAYKGGEKVFSKTKYSGGHVRKSFDHSVSKIKVYHKGKLVAVRSCGHDHQDQEEEDDIDCQAALWGARCRQISVRCDKTFTVKAYKGGEKVFSKTKYGGGHVRKSFDHSVSKIKVYHKGKLVTKKYCKHGDGGHGGRGDHDGGRGGRKPKTKIRFYKNCRRVRVKSSREVIVKAYTKREHKWGSKTITKRGKKLDWTVGRNNYFTKVRVYYKDELIKAKECDRDDHDWKDDDEKKHWKDDDDGRRKHKKRRGHDDDDKHRKKW